MYSEDRKVRLWSVWAEDRAQSGKRKGNYPLKRATKEVITLDPSAGRTQAGAWEREASRRTQHRAPGWKIGAGLTCPFQALIKPKMLREVVEVGSDQANAM